VLTATLATADTVFDERSVAIRVRANHAPHVELDYVWVRVSAGESVTLRVQAVDVEDGVLRGSSILWTTSDGGSGSDTTFSFVPTQPQTVVRVGATDSRGATSSDSAVVLVFPAPSGTAGVTTIRNTPSFWDRTELLVDGPQQQMVFVDHLSYYLDFFTYGGATGMRLGPGSRQRGLFAVGGGFYHLQRYPSDAVRLLDLGGGLVWEWPFTSPAGGDAVAAAEAADGSLLVVARVGVAPATADTLLVTRLGPSGSLLWADTLPSRHGQLAAAIAAGGTMYAAQALDSVVVLALDPSDGRVLWRSVTPGGELRAFAVAGDGAPLLLDRASRGLTVLDPSTGAVRWVAEASASRSPVADGAGNVYLLSRPRFNTTRLEARDAVTGAIRWSAVVDTAGLDSLGAMASAANGDVYVTAGYSLYRVDAGTHAVTKLYEDPVGPLAGGLAWDEGGSLAVFFPSNRRYGEGRLIRWAVSGGPSAGWPSLNGGGRGSRRARP
jgi:hypothetical protein